MLSLCGECMEEGHNVRICTNARADGQNNGVNKEKASNDRANVGQSSTPMADIRRRVTEDLKSNEMMSKNACNWIKIEARKEEESP